MLQGLTDTKALMELYSSLTEAQVSALEGRIATETSVLRQQIGAIIGTLVQTTQTVQDHEEKMAADMAAMESKMAAELESLGVRVNVTEQILQDVINNSDLTP